MQQIRGRIVGNEGVGVMEEEGEVKAGRYKHKERRYVKKVKKQENKRGV